MEKRDIIVIGGSAGSLDVLKNLAANLPADFPAAIFIVWHIHQSSPGMLPEILMRSGRLPAVNAADFDKIEPGRIYVAPPDYHLLVEESRVRTTKGPKENRFRPAIDPLFRSAAQSFGSRVIGVILSGGLDDGVSGLWSVKERGGIAVIQDPNDAEFSSMPERALATVEADFCVPASELAELLIHLISKQSEEIKIEINMEDDKNRQTERKREIEVGIASEDEALKKGILELGEPSLFTCPECHGVLLQMSDGTDIIRFRCHTGHAYSSGTLLSALTEAIEEAAWNTIRVMEENSLLLDHLSKHLKDRDQNLSQTYKREAGQIQERSAKVREIAFDNRRQG